MKTKRNQSSHGFARVRGSLTAVAAVWVLGTSVAQAYDIVAGSACEAADGNYGSQVTTSVGAVGNRSTTGALQVNCPMATDFYTFNKLYVSVSVQKNSAASMSCAVVTRNAAFTAGTVTSQALTGTGHKDYNFPDVPQSYFNTVRCTVPNATTTSSSTRSWVNGYFYSHS